LAAQAESIANVAAEPPSPKPSKPSRRAILAAGGVAVAGIAASRALQPRWSEPAPVFIARDQTYASDLRSTIRHGLEACGLTAGQFAYRRVLLKPNLVEPNRRIPHMTTHAAMIVAAADVFRAWGASVSVGEAPGHMRDTLFALTESGVLEALRQNKIPFVDLNYEETVWRPNLGGFSGLDGMHFPRSIVEADLVVSLPKLKTHHWVGMTATMKNFYGVLPGIKYGWPKNVLHHNGIPETVVDINCSLPRTLGIIDAIECMEGDGPILGSMKPLGLILVGGNLPAVDATAARIMGLEPTRVSYLGLAEHRLGPLDERLIEQRGEKWQSVASPFEIIDEEHLQRLRSTTTGPLIT
jgi:uncharacterized protein (DUF362 family)